MISYFSELPYLIADSFWIILELLLVTSCVSTIIFILTRNQYVSLLSSAPVFFVASLSQYNVTHLFFLIVAMVIQAAIIVTIQHQRKKN